MYYCYEWAIRMTFTTVRSYNTKDMTRNKKSDEDKSIRVKHYYNYYGN